ncbi:hypothetical protein SDC9_140390 [bioreactor metagenome]|uniref:Uncharacterized protein n=1 Tax=bioreactor metagenome TaxID=1076179 RepID=A0A645DUR2_9ZZZZ
MLIENTVEFAFILTAKLTALGVFGGGGEAKCLKSLGVDRGRVSAGSEKDDGAVGGNLIKVMPIWHTLAVGEIVLVPAPAAKRLTGRQVVGREKILAAGNELGHRSGAVKLYHAEVSA